jgi:hypothetical protein
MIKTICRMLILLLFNGCVQNSAFLGPAVTVAGTGNIHQAGLSYVSSKTVAKITGKTPVENIKTFLKMSEDDQNKDANNFFNVVKKINKKSGIKDLANQ